METPSPDRDLSESQVETPNQGNETLNNVISVVQETLGDVVLRPQLTEPSQINKEIQVRTESFEQKNNDTKMKMREEMENKFEAILKEIRTNKSALTITNLRSSGSKNDSSTGNIKNSDTEEDDHLLRASDMNELKNPARSFQRTYQTSNTMCDQALGM